MIFIIVLYIIITIIAVIMNYVYYIAGESDHDSMEEAICGGFWWAFVLIKGLIKIIIKW